MRRACRLIPSLLSCGARREAERKAGGGGDLHLARGRDFMQCAAGESAAERGVDDGNAERQRLGAFVETRRPFGCAQLPSQPADERLGRPAGGRPGGNSWSGG